MSKTSHEFEIMKQELLKQECKRAQHQKVRTINTIVLFKLSRNGNYSWFKHYKI
jgi:hypothetical protein